MNTPGKADLSHDDVLAKMDALLKKHHIGTETSPPDERDFPVLTEIVDVPPRTPTAADEDILIDFEVDSDDFPVLEEVIPQQVEAPVLIPDDEPPVQYQAASVSSEPQPVTHTFPHGRTELPSALQDQALLEQRIADHIIASLDTALGNLLVQFSTHLESMVRETVAQEINRQLTALLRQDEEHGGAPE